MTFVLKSLTMYLELGDYGNSINLQFDTMFQLVFALAVLDWELEGHLYKSLKTIGLPRSSLQQI